MSQNLEMMKDSNKKYAILTKQLEEELREFKGNHFKMQ
jgi:hypothetical protein